MYTHRSMGGPRGSTVISFLRRVLRVRLRLSVKLCITRYLGIKKKKLWHTGVFRQNQLLVCFYTSSPAISAFLSWLLPMLVHTVGTRAQSDCTRNTKSRCIDELNGVHRRTSGNGSAFVDVEYWVGFVSLRSFEVFEIAKHLLS